ncbi:MAG: transglutaminase-like cysteine peptidase [Sphingomicrobium sp.]
MRIGIGLLLACVVASSANAATGGPNRRSCAVPMVATAAAAPQMLGTSATPIRAERFSASWAHANEDASSLPALQGLIRPAYGLCPAEQLEYVQAAVHRQIHWGSDATQWGRHDYWASAAETLARGAGDEEDVAVLKMQALRALGFSANDLFITLGRDTIGGPLVVLAARVGGRYFILDENGGRPWNVDERRAEFQPSISFGSANIWVHTRDAPVGAAPPRASIFAASR